MADKKEIREAIRELEHKGLVKKSGKFVDGHPVYVMTCEAARELERLGVPQEKCPAFDDDAGTA